MRSALGIALALLALNLAVGAVAECPTDGCPVAKSPVCGADGLTYMTDCIAECQGVQLVAAGPCTRAAGAALAAAAAAASAAAAGTPVPSAAELGKVAAAAASVVHGFAANADTRITLADMQRYADEGLVLVGAAKRVEDFKPEAPELPRIAKARNIDYALAAASWATISIDTGFIYKHRDVTAQVAAARASTVAAAGAGNSAAFVDGVMPDADNAVAAAAAGADDDASAAPPVGVAAPGGRKLRTIYGVDDRREIIGQQSFPWSTMGLVDFLVDGANSGCSGSLIGPQAVLTAAHCILGKAKGTIASSWRFSPNHDRYGPDSRFGTANGVRVFYSTNYWQARWADTIPWDMAVVIVSKPLGTASKAGALGFSYNNAGYTGGLASAGYPGDKDEGSYWYFNTDKCRVSDKNGADGVLPHKCDVVGGQSGSAMFEVRLVSGVKQHYVRAVVKGHSDETNYATEINKFWFDYIKANKAKTS